MTIVIVIFVLAGLAESLRVEIGRSECILSYHFTNSTIAFDSCQFNTTMASNYYIHWHECCTSCCGLSIEGFPAFDMAALQRCINNAQANSPTSPLVFAMVVVISVAAVLTITFIIYRAIIKIRNRQVLPREAVEEIIISKIKWQSSNEMEQENLQTLSDLVDNQDSCAICLEGKLNTRLPCLHWFHLSCLLHWVHRSKECPLCRTSNIAQVTVYCKKFRYRFTVINFENVMMAIDGLLSSKFGDCDHCQRIHQTRSAIQQSFQVFKKDGQIS